jgi:hypothetical protein
MHMFGWFSYYMWLTWLDSCDLWTLGGRTYLSLQDLAWWKAIREGLVPFDLHRGLEAHEMDARPHVWAIFDDERCTLMMEDIAFGGILA